MYRDNIDFSPLKEQGKPSLHKTSKSFSQEAFNFDNEAQLHKDFKKFVRSKQYFDGNSNVTQEQLFESFLLFQKFVSSLVQSNEDQPTKRTYWPNESRQSNSSLRIIEENPLAKTQQESSSYKTNAIKNSNRSSVINVNTKAKKNYVNHDDIPIKGNTTNFVDLVEKNLEEMKNSPELFRELSLDRAGCNSKKISCGKAAKQNQLTRSMNIKKKAEDKRKGSLTRNNPYPIQVSSLKENPPMSSNHYEAEEDTIRQEEFLFNLIPFQEGVPSRQSNPIEKSSPQFFPLKAPCSKLKEESTRAALLSKPHESLSDSDDIIDNNSNMVNDSLLANEKKREMSNSKQKQSQGRQRSSSKNKEDAENVSQLLQEIKASANAISASLCSPIASYSHKKKVEECKMRNELSKEIQSIKEEKAKVEQIKNDYEQKNCDLLREIDEYKKKEKQSPIEDAVKSEELTQLKLSKKRDKEVIADLHSQIQTLKEEKKLKEMMFQITIEKLELQLKKANAKVTDLQSSQSYLNSNIRNKAMSSHKSSTNILSKKASSTVTKAKNVSPSRKPMSNSTSFSNADNDSFDLIFPSKYKIDGNMKVVSEERTKDDKVIRTYANKAKEIIYSSGSRKVCFEDGYQIFSFINNDIKQIYPNGKCVYYYSGAKATQTTLPDKTNVYKLKNGQIEKHYQNGNKEIIYPGGKAKIITSNGLVDLSNPLLVQRKEGNTLITSDSMQS